MSSAFFRISPRRRGWLIVAVTVLLCLAVRIRLRDMPLEGDEGEYAYAGQLMLQGIPPYKLAYNMKLPGTYAAYAVIMAVFGQTPAGIHVGVACVNAASIVLIFLIGRRLLDETTGAVAAITYGLLSLSPSVLGLAGHATHFVVLPALAGTLLLMRAAQSSTSKVQSVGPGSSVSSVVEGSAPVGAPPLKTEHWILNTSFWSRRSILLSGSGLLFGLSFLMKQHGFFFGIFAGLYLLWCRFAYLAAGRDPRDRYRSRHERKRRKLDVSRSAAAAFPLTHLFTFSAAFVAPYALACFILLLAGVFPQFWFWTVSYAGKYASTVPVAFGPDLLKNALDVVIGPNLMFWILAGLGLAWLFWENRFLQKETRRTKNFQTPKLSNSQTSTNSQTSAASANSQTPKLLNSQTSIDSQTPQLSNSQTPAACPLPSPIAFTLLFLVCSFASVSVGFHYRSHYFITLLPALALLTGLAVSHALYLLQRVKTLELFLALPVPILLVVGILWNLAGNGPIWFTLPPAVAETVVYHSTAHQAAAQIAKYIRQQIALPNSQTPKLSNSETSPRSPNSPTPQLPNSQTSAFPQSPPSANSQTPKLLNAQTSIDSQTSATVSSPVTIAVIGSEPEIYFLSRQRSATGYIYMYPLMEVQPFALTMQEELIAQVETNRPEYVVYVNDDLSWLKWSQSDLKVFDWWKKYWSENLELVETYPIQEQHAESLWEKAPELKQAFNADGSPKSFLVFKRKTDANR